MRGTIRWRPTLAYRVHFDYINISNWTNYKILLQREIGPKLNQIWVLKYIFIPLHDGDLFLRSHSERTILLQYMFQITVIIITFSYKQKKYIFVN